MMDDRQVNAFATVGGYIGVNAGLVLVADTEDEVAGVLGHEIAHVAAGTRWYQYCCERDGVEPIEMFFSLLRDYMGINLRGPFNRPARLEAGFVEEELDRLLALAP